MTCVCDRRGRPDEPRTEPCELGCTRHAFETEWSQPPTACCRASGRWRHDARVPTELVYLRDADHRTLNARITEVDGDRIALDKTAF